MPRGRPKKAESEASRQFIHQRPNFLDKLPSRGGKAGAIAKLSQKLGLCKPTETVCYPETTFKELFHTKVPIKQELNYICGQLKYVYKRLGVRRYHDEETQKIYFWENRLNGKRK